MPNPTGEDDPPPPPRARKRADATAADIVARQAIDAQFWATPGVREAWEEWRAATAALPPSPSTASKGKRKVEPPAPAPESPRTAPRGRVVALAALIEDGRLRSLSLRPGPRGGLAWTVKGTTLDGAPGYVYGTGATLADCLLTADYCVSKEDWRPDKF